MTSNKRMIGTLPKRVAQLDKAFNLVKNPIHWQEPINTKLSLDVLSQNKLSVDDVKEAIEFYTATTATTEIESGFVTVKAKGYRLGPVGKRHYGETSSHNN